jgi:hypothetical protein
LTASGTRGRRGSWSDCPMVYERQDQARGDGSPWRGPTDPARSRRPGARADRYPGGTRPRRAAARTSHKPTPHAPSRPPSMASCVHRCVHITAFG